MFLIKNAYRNITRSKGRNILIGCIALVIGLSACLALSIKSAALSERENGLANLSVSATIGVDRMAMMEKAKESGSEGIDNRSEMLKGMQSLSLEEMQTYAKATSVQDFYYSATVYVNGESIDAVDTSSSASDAQSDERKGGPTFENQGDFTLIGYSSYDAMQEFVDEESTITQGELFEEESNAFTCIINEELAALNDVAIGDTIELSNPRNDTELVTMKVVGFYASTSTSTQNVGPKGMAMMDPANGIYVSYHALQSLLTNSAQNTSNTSEQTQLVEQVNGTYEFADVENYNAFESEVRTLGLDDSYTVSSLDVTAYEQSLKPLDNLSTYATYFLVVILVIGGSILVVLNIFHIRERKYEIGVLAAIGMKKAKIATQFICEIFIVILLSILLGTALGAVVSVPATNTLLASQISTTTSAQPFGNTGMQTAMEGERAGSEQHGGMMGGSVNYIREITQATDVMVVLELVAIAIILTIISGGIAVLTILRYEPLKILSNRE